MTTPDPRYDEHLVRRSRELYRQAAQQLDPQTVDRLRAARRQALATARTSQHFTARWLIPSGAFAAIALAALMLWQPVPRHDAAPSQGPVVVETAAEVDNDLPPDADQTDPHLYQDLDFYGWLAASDNPGGNRPTP